MRVFLHSLHVRFLLFLACAMFLLVLFFVAALRMHTRELLVSEAHEKANLISAHAEAIQSYVRGTLRPAVAALIGADEFVIEAMSTSYVTRHVLSILNIDKESFQYRRVAQNARNPISEATEEELQILFRLMESPKLARFETIVGEGADEHLIIARPLYLTQDCMRCHGVPEDAPAVLLSMYGNERGFGKKLGELAGLDIISVSMQNTSNAVRKSVVMFGTGFSIGMILLFCVVQGLFNRLVVYNLRRVGEILQRLFSKKEEGGKVVTVAGAANGLVWKGYSPREAASGIEGMVRAIEALVTQLADARQQLEAVINNYKGVIWGVDGSGTITTFNGQYLKKIGVTPSFLEGKKLEVARLKSRHLDIIDHVERTFHEGPQDWIGEIEGGVFHSSTTPIYDDNGNIIGVIGSTDDVTEIIKLQRDLEVALESAQSANKAKSIFLANVSHEIRTPMNAIIGMAELALREGVTPAVQEHIHTIKQASASLLSIINDILDLSKIETGKLEIVPKEYLLSSLINDVISIIKAKVFESRLQFIVNIDNNLPNVLFGDDIRIKQIILNILSNAVKYTQHGFISLNITGKIITDNSIILTIQVIDSGKGIKQEDIKKLFSIFMRVDITSNTNIEGTGLGLAIAQSLVKAMDGEIEVVSVYGEGSTFTVTLPQQVINSQKLAIVEYPENKNTLIYELRDVCKKSIMHTLDNFGINYKLVSTDQEFYDGIMSKQYAFAFVATVLYENIIKKYTDIESTTKIILLSEFGETVSEKNISILTAPFFSIPVANFLNGVSESYSRRVNYETMVRFTAPTAKVLIVDDTITNLKVAEGLLKPYRMQIDVCKSGTEAINAVKSERYDLVFMDHMMPEMDGIEATARIRALSNTDLHYKHLPIIALTANAIAGAKEMFLNTGFNDFLSKPIDLFTLDSILTRWIPDEKQQYLPITRWAEAAEIERIASESIAIDGLNVKNGIALVGGSIKDYLSTLAVFHKDGLEKIREIKACLATHNLALYTIHVHALKAATASIGADRLSETAKTLEIAGKQGDMLFIHAHNAAFMLDLETLLSSIQAVILQTDIEDRQHSTDMESLKAELSELKASLTAFDSFTMHKTVNGLERFTRIAGIGAVVEDILYKVLIGEYDEAIVLIDSLTRAEQH